GGLGHGRLLAHDRDRLNRIAGSADLAAAAPDPDWRGPAAAGGAGRARPHGTRPAADRRGAPAGRRGGARPAAMTFLLILAALVLVLLTGLPVFAALGLFAGGLLLAVEGSLGSVGEVIYGQLDVY